MSLAHLRGVIEARRRAAAEWPHNVRGVLVGELNPYGSDPRYALFPAPANSAGARMCKLVMGLDPVTYISSYDRVNLCTGAWSVPMARTAAIELLGRWLAADLARRDAGRPFRTPPPGRVGGVDVADTPFVLLGARVAAAFGIHPFIPFTVFTADKRAPDCAGRPIIVLPHPSGLNRLWSDPSAVPRARAILCQAGVLDG